jgi:hypothetical protein
MKMVIKKTYCPVDKGLETVHEQKTGETTKLICSKCGTALYVKEDWGWRFLKNEPVAAAKKK